MGKGPGQGEETDACGPCGFEQARNFIDCGTRCKNVIDKKDGTAAHGSGAQEMKSAADIDSPRLASEKTLREDGRPTNQTPRKKPRAPEEFVDSLGEKTGLVEFAFKAPARVEGNRKNPIVGSKRDAPREKLGQLGIKNPEEVAAPLKLNLVEEFFDEAIVAEKRPALLRGGKRHPDSFFRRFKPKRVEPVEAFSAEPFFFEFEETAANRAQTRIKKSEEGFSQKGNFKRKFHDGLLYWREEEGSRTRTERTGTFPHAAPPQCCFAANVPDLRRMS